jgi:hypothetical protein
VSDGSELTKLRCEWVNDLENRELNLEEDVEADYLFIHLKQNSKLSCIAVPSEIL